MRKFLSATILVVFASAIGWYYLPQNWREKIFASMGVVLRGDQQEVKKFIGEVVLSQDPEKRRAVLLQELKKDVAEIKRRESGDTAKSKEDEVGQVATNTGEFIGAVEKVIKELEIANADKSVSREVVERIVERLLPSVRQEVIECRR